MGVRARRLLVLGATILFVMLLFGGVSVSVSLGASPWWRLGSGARPTYLHAGVARDEVQEILTTPEEFEGFAEQTNFLLFIKKEGTPEKIAEFATEPVAAKFSVTLLTAANIQTALEEKAYGTGNVTVKEETVDKGGKPLEHGDKRYLVTSVGEKADEAVTPLEAFGAVAGGIGTAEARVASTGQADGEIAVTAENVGDANVNGGVSPVVIKDVLPAGLTAVGVSGTAPEPGEIHKRLLLSCSIESARVVTCESTGSLPPYDLLEMRVAVMVSGAAKSGGVNEASVTGGEAQSATIPRPVTISSAPTPFGVEDYELLNEQEGGAPDVQAGSHPFQQTTSITLNQTADTAPLASPEIEANPAGLPKDLHIKWPPGLIGNPTPIPRCTIAQFLTVVTENGEENECPAQSAVGVAVVTVRDFTLSTTLRIPVPLFNLEPAVGEPARFGFYVILGNSPVVIDTAIRTGEDYGVSVLTNNITQTAGFLSADVTVWGAPQDPSHDDARGWGCLFAAHGVKFPHAPCIASRQQHSPPFLSLPTSCTGPLQSTIEGDPWAQPGSFRQLAGYELPALDGCNKLPFSPSINVSPDGQAASTPTGLNVDVHVNQEESLNPTGLAEADVKNTTVTLPAGVVLNPAAADGLQACSQEQAALNSPGESHCPEASKVATAELTTPVLPNPLTGAVYVAQQNANPFGSLLALYLIIKDPVSGVLVKLAGEVKPDPVTGQLTSTFKNTPQAPFEDLKLHFFGGDRAPLATPATCGQYTTTARITPWSENFTPEPSSTFEITTGPNASACQNPLSFAPTLTAGTTNIQAGAFSPLTTTMSRQDGQQPLGGIQIHMPPGLSGMLTGVKLCPEPQADEGTCPPESLIGETTVSVGLGNDPYSVKGGKVYITGPYHGAPFGLSVVNPAKAGPYDLGQGACDCIVVRARLEIDPHTAQLTVSTDNEGPYKIPTILQGIPLQIKHVNVLITRPRFTFNPTNCNPQTITANLTSTEKTTAPLTIPFQATNCATLKFAPNFKVTTNGHTSKENGASLTAKILYPPTPPGTQATNYAGIKSVKVDLPKQLPSRLSTLHKACLAATFETNPANCPPASIVGHARVITPLLPVPLTGPAYFVSHGGEAFPSLTMILQGYGITIQLIGNTFIKNGITSSTFKNTPDVPFTLFELTLPQGKNSALAATTNLCKTKLNMPTQFNAQNGITIHQTTKITATGCKHNTKSKKTARNKRK